MPRLRYRPDMTPEEEAAFLRQVEEEDRRYREAAEHDAKVEAEWRAAHPAEAAEADEVGESEFEFWESLRRATAEHPSRRLR